MASAWRTSSLIGCHRPRCRSTPPGTRLAVVVVLLEVLEQAGPGRLPSEQFPGYGGGGGAVQGDEVAQVAEVLDGVGGGTDAVGMPR